MGPGRTVRGSFVSGKRGNRRTSWAVAYPPGSSTSARLPLLVFLHGLGQDHRAAFGTQLGLDRFLAAHVKGGGSPFAIASVDGGTTYYHPRPEGQDAGAMVLDELVPLLAGRGLRTERIGLMGLSMGGYGVLRLGGLLGAARCAVVVAESPAIWTNPDDASQIFAWQLSRITDTLGNAIVFAYASDGGSVYLQRIDYTQSPGGLPATNTITFETEQRPDVETSYQLGFRVVTALRLARVLVDANGNRMPSLQLSYGNAPSDATGRSLLRTITVVAADGSQLPSTLYRYQGGAFAQAFSTRAGGPTPKDTIDRQCIAGDFTIVTISALIFAVSAGLR